jgi:hypothetical protein
MQKLILTLLGILVAAISMAQVTGQITDEKGEPLIGVNVYIQNTYDGGTTDVNGKYSFATTETGDQVLVISFIGFKPQEYPINVNKPVVLNAQLKEEVSVLSGVTITAGSFEASDEKKSTVLKSLDIAMTAGATADIAGALNTLPGTTTNGESGRLFVRGGTANETQAFIDGVLVQNFYSASPNNVPSRGRFSPFLFKGTFFSTGGYSAEYGQALSSVLSLSSNDLPDETRTDLSFMTVGGDISHTQKWADGSIYGQLQFTNLNPYNSLIKQNYDWIQGFTSMNGTTMLRQQISGNDMLKVYAQYDQSQFELISPSVNSPQGNHIDLVNRNTYINSSYRFAVGQKSTGYLGLGFGHTSEDVNIDGMNVSDDKSGQHVKGYITTDFTAVAIKVGGELIATDHTEDVVFVDNTQQYSEYSNDLIAAFVESDYYVTNNLTLRAGFRYEHYSLLQSATMAPRLSMAVKTGEYSQVSGAYGQFYQMPAADLLIRSQLVTNERADHYMISYQRIKSGRTFRGEVYFKDYSNLVRYDANDPYNPEAHSNSGSGYASGIDVFYRDSKTIKNGDFWISYSLIDTKRIFRDYPVKARTTFAAKHNASVVYKHFLPKLKTQIGATLAFNSGRPYNNPNNDGFNEEITKAYADLSFNFAYLHRQHVILYASATNLLGRRNVFGHEFETTPGTDGVYQSRDITQPAKRFLFVGLFITLTKSQSKNNLENL